MKKKSEEKEKLGGYQNVQDTTRKPYFDFNQVGSSPTTPPTGVMRMFTKTDGSAYLLDNQGVETTVGGATGSGDMTRAVYDSDDDGKVTSAVTADNATQLNSQSASYYATAGDLTSHTGNTSNPHSVTAAQVSAVPTSYLDTDSTMAANSDAKVATQKATKAHVVTQLATLTKSSVGLGNVDNTSDATKNAASVALTNKTIDVDSNTVSNIEVDNFKSGVIDTDGTLLANSDTKLATQRAVKAYADSVRTGTAARIACDVATDAALPACTYDNGTGGVGATLTGDAVGALTVDGVDLNATGAEGNGRVLVKDQANGAHNGVYLVTEAGDVGTAFILTRVTDYDAADASEISSGSFFTVIYGTENNSSLWMLATTGTIVVGTTSLVFTPLPVAGAYTASNGVKVVTSDMQIDLSDTNPSLEVSDGGLRAKVDGSTIERAAGGLQIKDGGVTAAKIANAAGIPYSKLTLTNEIVNADIDDAAAIAETKLALDVATATLDSTKLAKTLNSAQIFVGNGSNVATGVAMSGDVAVDNTGATTIQNGAVEYPMLAGSIPDSKLDQITTASKVSGAALIALASIPSGAGQVPVANLGTGTGSSSNYLRGDGAWSPVTGTSSDYSVTPLYFMNKATAVTWTNMPAAVTTFYSAVLTYRTRLDLTYATQYRIVVYMSVAGATNADLNLQYSLDGSTSWTACDTGGAGELAIGSTGFKASSWTNLVAGAKTDVHLRVVGKEGDGIIDPVFYDLKVEFKYPVYSRKIQTKQPIAETTTLTTGDGIGYINVPSEMNGLVIAGVEGFVYTVSSSGAVNIQLHNMRTDQDILSTALTIDANEYTSDTAATPAVINATYDDVQAGDRIRIDVDGAGTGTKGLEVKLRYA